MALACGDHIRFYSSPDLKRWTEDSRFGGPGVGAHGGVWECPDLLPLVAPDGRTHWVLLVSLTPGGPNGGSATQSFIGSFDGRRFTPHDDRIRWLDHGPDNYAGVTWAEVDDRALFIGWMSNWQYADKVPTAPWRSAMTMPRELVLREGGDGLRVASLPAREMLALCQPATQVHHGVALSGGALDLSAALAGAQGRVMVDLRTAGLRSFALVLSNDAGDRLQIGFDALAGVWWIDRRDSGDVGFHPVFAQRAVAPRLVATPAADLQLWFDATSVELFADGGLSVLTALFFPRATWSRMSLTSDDGMMVSSLAVSGLRDPR
jgi:fructan beta-fructosidase